MPTIVGRFVAKARHIGFAAASGRALNLAIRKLGLRALPPYEYVQRDVQRHLHSYLRVPREEIRRIVIVGAHLAYEVPDMLSRFRNVRFTLFEASPRYLDALHNRFRREHRVSVVGAAITDHDGQRTFYETNAEGSGSLLQLGDLAASSFGMRQTDSFLVPALRLDSHVLGHEYSSIDCLWIDVQGAELSVLRGASRSLAFVRSVFVEVSIHEPLYVGGATMPQLDEHLERAGFRLAALGTDHATGTGNAFYLRAS